MANDPQEKITANTSFGILRPKVEVRDTAHSGEHVYTIQYSKAIVGNSEQGGTLVAQGGQVKFTGIVGGVYRAEVELKGITPQEIAAMVRAIQGDGKVDQAEDTRVGQLMARAIKEVKTPNAR
mgnify:CR=1 FL=1